MDLRRLSIVLMIFAAGLLGIIWIAQNQSKQRLALQENATLTQPVSQPVAIKPAVKQPAATKAPEPKPAPDKPAGPKVYTDTISQEKFVTIGSLADKDGYLFAVDISNRGAGVHTVKLKNHFATVADKKRYQKEPATYLQAILDEPDKYKGLYSVLNPVGTKGQIEHLPFETEKLSIEIADAPKPIEVNLMGEYWRLVNVSDDPSSDSQVASFAVTVYRGMNPSQAKKNPLVRLTKTYTVNKQDYSVDISLSVKNLSASRLSVSLDQSGPTGVPREDPRMDMRRATYAHLLEDQRVQNRSKDLRELGSLLLDKNSEHKIGSSDGIQPVLWVGQASKFFGSMMYLKPVFEDRLEVPSWKAEFYLSRAKESATSQTYLTGVRIPQLRLKPQQVRTLSFDVFAGPKKRSLFNDEKAEYFKQLYKKLNYIGTIHFRGCTFAWLTLAMMWLLDLFSKIALGNYGVAIIILVLLVRLILHPLTKKSQVSMLGMQKLAPQMQKIKEKYADDKDTLNKETMKLYKQQGATPLLGCLPMLLQLPIWMALFSGLNANVELRHAAFLPVWITDLAAPDKLFTWSAPSLPFIGTSFNLLPILLAIAMFLQAKFGPQSQQMAASEQAQQQQKMMKYMLPGMMIVFFYPAPSGLTLYIMASTFAGLVDQYFVRKHIREKEAAEAAVQATVVVPGKASRGSRPKKPKGPFWVKGG